MLHKADFLAFYRNFYWFGRLTRDISPPIYNLMAKEKGPSNPYVFREEPVFGSHQDPQTGVTNHAFSMQDAVWRGSNDFVVNPASMESAVMLYAMLVEPGYDSCAPLCPDSKQPLATEESGAHKDMAFMAARMSAEDRREVAEWLYEGIDKGLKRERGAAETSIEATYAMAVKEAGGDSAKLAQAEKNRKAALTKDGPIKSKLFAIAGANRVHSFLFDYGDHDKDEPVLLPPTAKNFYSLDDSFQGPYDSDKRRTYFKIEQGEKASELFLQEKVAPTRAMAVTSTFKDVMHSTGNGGARAVGLLVGFAGMGFRKLIGIKNKDHNISDAEAMRAVVSHHFKASMQSGRPFGGQAMVKGIYEHNAPGVVPSLAQNPNKYNPALLPESAIGRQDVLVGLLDDMKVAVDQKDEKRVFQTCSRLRHFSDLCTMVPPKEHAGAELNPAFAAWFHRSAKFHTAAIKGRAMHQDFDKAGDMVKSLTEKKNSFFKEANDEIQAKQIKERLEKAPMHELLGAELGKIRESMAAVHHTAAVAVQAAAANHGGHSSDGIEE